MRTVREVAALQAAVAALRTDGATVAFVPTMGALHAGHMALIAAARASKSGAGGAKVVASIFVNPKQFGPGEDLARYPRSEIADAGMLADAGCDLLWAPPAQAMYPEGFATTVNVADVADTLDGVARPGHFDGVATVVLKLLNQVRPDRALFGEKDWQQLQVVRRMATDLDLGIEIACVPTQREDDGLALSSRNIYLSDDERARAVALPRALRIAAARIARGDDADAALAEARETLVEAGFRTDYVTLVDAETLVPASTPDRARRLLAAARLGATRLIDNVAID